MYVDPNHFQLSSLGTSFPLDIFFEPDQLMGQLQSFEKCWKPYNNRKADYRRYGLSLFSLDGGMTGVPDLDSIWEYNVENGTNYDETSFSTPTPAWKEIREISQYFEPVQNSIVRSHILRLDTGGFFPPHRDICEAFRLICLFNCSPVSVHLSIEGAPIPFQPCKVYFLDTHKTHSLVSFQDNAYVLVLNLKYDAKTIQFVQDHRLDK